MAMVGFMAPKAAPTAIAKTATAKAKAKAKADSNEKKKRHANMIGQLKNAMEKLQKVQKGEKEVSPEELAELESKDKLLEGVLQPWERRRQEE